MAASPPGWSRPFSFEARAAEVCSASSGSTANGRSMRRAAQTFDDETGVRKKNIKTYKDSTYIMALL
jgi:hypothetical protein